MNLRQARATGRLGQFIRQRERAHPHTRKRRFRAVLKLMALNKRKPRRRTKPEG
ncbi:MAG TPA: hypothetical protein VMV72_18505 [Verrucomicrobiae bacterium]|nr:hypothetical protein [Verrucomicrobiae bacterium]